MKKVLLLLCFFVFSNVIAQQPVPLRHFRESNGIMKEVVGNTIPTQTGANSTLINDRFNDPNKAISLNNDFYQSTVPGNIVDYSVSLFVKTNTNDNSVRTIIDFSSDHGIHIYLANGKINFEYNYRFYYLGTPYTSNLTYGYGQASINDNNWHNVIFRMRRANTNNMYVETYVDGQLDHSSVIVITGLNAYGYLGSSITAGIGTKNNLTSARFQEGIDDIKFFNSSLTDTQITLISKDRVNPETVYVNKNATGNNDGSSWTDAFTSLTTALNYAVLNNDEIWVAKGTYFPNTSSRSNSFTPKAEIKIFGGFTGNETLLSDRDESLLFGSNATVLNGDLNQDDDANITFNNLTRDDNSYNVVTINTNNCVLDGLIIKNGYADGTATNTTYGAGIYKHENVTNLTLKSCKIANNVGYYGAGAYLVTNDDSNIEIDRCIFENNLASLGASSFYSFLNSSSTKTLNFTITNSLFYANKTANDAVKGRNAIGGSAGWIRAYYANTLINFNLINNTIVNNINEGSGSGAFPTFGVSKTSTNAVLNATTANNLFYSNKKNNAMTAQAFNTLSTDVNLGGVTVYNSFDDDSFSNIASGNKFNVIAGNPMLYSDFSLLMNSPALDYGDNSKVPAGIIKDLYGNVRIQNSTVDLGAVEGISPLSSEVFTNRALNMYPNPVKDILTIQSDEEIENVTLFNYAGQEIKAMQVNNTINISNLASGIYVLKVKITTGDEIIKKIIKE